MPSLEQETKENKINLTPTYLQSWVEWRKVYTRGPIAFNLLMDEFGLKDRLPYYNEFLNKYGGKCPYCKESQGENYLQLVQSKVGTVYCICALLSWLPSYIYRYTSVRSNTPPATLGEIKYPNSLVPSGSSLSILNELRNAVEAADTFIKYPKRWMLLAGLKGTGKTHILRAINTALWPMAIYVTTGDLERKVHEARKSDSIDDLDSLLSYAPVLLIDDIGMEYGGPLVKSLIEKVINVRYEQRTELPIIASTNKTPSELGSYIPRAADRLMDKAISDMFLLTHESYRASGGGSGK